MLERSGTIVIDSFEHQVPNTKTHISSHQSIRGPLLVLSNLSGMLGVVSMYMLGAYLPWRQVALVCLAIPCSALLLVRLVPETPYWLLVHERGAEALQSLQWLRGWVPVASVQDEYNEISRFVAESNICPECCRSNRSTCEHRTGYWTRCMELCQPKTLRPLFVVAVGFMLSHACGMSAMRPFLVQIFKVFRVPLDASYCSVIVGVVELFSYVLVLLVVRFSGKRLLFLVSTAAACGCIFALGVHALMIFPSGASSFDEQFVHKMAGLELNNVFALVVFMTMALCAGAASGIPWILLAELYPIR